MSLLTVRDLSVVFPTRDGSLCAVDRMNFSLEAGETLGLVGESGSGKSVSVSSLMGLVPSPPARISGEAMFQGVNLIGAPSGRLRRIRGKKISMVFQDPMTSLNPCHRVVDQVAEPLRVHDRMPAAAARRRAVAALEAVGIADAARRCRAYPHQFSGGMRQRVMLAMAMITEPELLIADEPTTALDVTVQRQILDLIRRLQREHGTAVIFISHDLAVVSDVCARIMVMRNGETVESGKTAEVLTAPAHPYTRGLLQCHPALHAAGSRLRTLEEVMRETTQKEGPA